MSEELIEKTKKKKKIGLEKIHRVNFYDEQLSLENFMKAIYTNDVAMVEAYLEHGQNPNEHAGDFVTALHIAAMYGFEYIVNILLRQPNIDVNAVDYIGRTPLARACKYSFLHIVKLLLEHNADCNIADKTGYTPLHHTALWGLQDIMIVLLKYEANPNISNAFGKTPLHIVCVDNPNTYMIQLLCEHGADINLECSLIMPVLLVCCLNCFEYDDLNIIDLLIYYDADVNVVYKQNGQTAMHVAAITGFVPLAEILCTAGANPNVMDNQFRTPYDIAVQLENQEMIKFLRLFFEEESTAIERKFDLKSMSTIREKNKNNKRKRQYETF